MNNKRILFEPSYQQGSQTRLIVRRAPGVNRHEGILTLAGRAWPCILGRSGISTNKHEGDGATPSGVYSLLHGYWRDERFKLPRNRLDSAVRFERVKPDLGWCDDPAHPAYNSEIPLPFAAGHEKLWREDRLYDCCIVLDHNISPQTRNRGSAIFFHLTSPDRRPTEGCIALDPVHMQQVLSWLAKPGINSPVMDIRP